MLKYDDETEEQAVARHAEIQKIRDRVNAQYLAQYPQAKAGTAAQGHSAARSRDGGGGVMRIFVLVAMDGECPYRVVRAYHSESRAEQDLLKAEAFATELGQARWNQQTSLINPGTDPGCCIENGFVSIYCVDAVELVE